MATPSITHEEALQKFVYDAETGILSWRVYYYGHKPGNPVGTLGAKRYPLTKIGGVNIHVHRLIWFYVHGRWPASMIDHIDGDMHNNRIFNLREADQFQNGANRKLARNNTTGYTGVRRMRDGFASSIFVRRKRLFLGCFKTVEEAAAVYAKAAEKHYGRYAPQYLKDDNHARHYA